MSTHTIRIVAAPPPWADYPPPARYRPARTDKPVAVYNYYDEQCRPRMKVVKYANPKDFRQWALHPESGFVMRKNVLGIQFVLYRLPELLAADRQAWVLVCEGEKDADSATAHGLIATTAPMGANAPWLDEYSDWLVRRKVAVIADNDLPGLQHARAVATALKGKARVVRLVELPGLEVGEDLTDWFERYRNTTSALVRLIEASDER